jgi:hypothetical protein
MILSIRQKVLFGLAAVLFDITANGMAQEPSVTMSAPAPACPGAGCSDQPVAIAAMRIPGAGPAQVGVVTTGGMAFGLQENADAVKNLSYQAQAITELKQTLADGSHIDQTTTATVARDSDGRTVRIQKLSTMGPWKSAADSSPSTAPTLTTIFDPVEQTHTDYTSDSKVAHVLPMPKLPGGAIAGQVSGFAMMVGPGPGAAVMDGPGPVTAGGSSMAFAVQGRADLGKAGVMPEVKTESLGNASIGDIPATGTRTTTTIPAGTIGNDRDIVITRETWYSSDLKLVIQSTQTDPRFGETTYSLTKIQRSEPDPTMFQVPAGYTIDKVPVRVQTLRAN